MKVKLKHKLRSGALQFTVFISVVVALILAGALLLAYTHRFFLEQSKAIVTNIQLADTGIAALLLQESISTDTLTLNLPDTREGQQVRINLSLWGIFEKAFVKATHGQKEFIKCSLLGSGIAHEKRPALYLQETFKPLAVVGSAHVEGDAYLPEQGITNGSIAGHSYYGAELVFGNVEKSTSELPKLKYDYPAQSNYYLKEFTPAADTDFIILQPGSSVINSFKNPSKGYISDVPIVLENISLTGNIVIRSTQKITVRKTANLKDLIIAAPEVIIEDGVTGNFQAFAQTTLKVGKNCLLSYPSALVLLQGDSPMADNNNPLANKLFIDSGSNVRGTVCFLATNIEDTYKANIYISLNSAIRGEVYCEGNLELRGNVNGTVYTKQFLTSEGGTVYVNHLYDAAITTKSFPDNFGGMLLENQTKSVIKWLY